MCRFRGLMWGSTDQITTTHKSLREAIWHFMIDTWSYWKDFTQTNGFMRESAEQQPGKRHCTELHRHLWNMLVLFRYSDRRCYKTHVSEPSQTYQQSCVPRSAKNLQVFNSDSSSFDLTISRRKCKHEYNLYSPAAASITSTSPLRSSGQNKL